MDRKQVFVLEIMDNQKDTWQGQVRWIQGQTAKPFRSVLEMLHLIDSVISSGQDEKERQKMEQKLRWEEEPAPGGTADV